MLDLDARLRLQFEETVCDLEPSDRLDELVHERRRLQAHRRRRRRQGAGGLAAVGLGATVLAVWSVLPAGDDGSSGPASVLAGSPTEAGEPLFLVPGASLPEGLELLEAAGGDRPAEGTEVEVAPDWDRTQRWVRFDAADGHPAEVLDIMWRGAPAGSRASSPEEGWIEQPVDDGQGSGALVRVHGYVARPGPKVPVTPLPAATLEAVLDAVAPRASGGFELDAAAAPDGFEPVGEWPGVAAEGTNPRVLAYRGPGDRGFQLQIVDGSELPPAASLDMAAARRVTIRGNDGVSTDHLLGRPSHFAPGTLFLDRADRYVQWLEPGGERVTLSALGMTEDELLAVAEGLEAVDADTWFALQDEPEPEPAAPSTTVTSSTVTSAPAGTADVADALRIDGSYEGIEHYTLASGRCDLDHVLDTTWSASDGTTWDFHQEYCGLLDGDLWTYGGGSFTLTAPDGATLTGDAREHSARGPTFNNPDQPGITLDIVDGTGAYAGATGECTLVNHVTQVALGEQHQDGTFTCSFTP